MSYEFTQKVTRTFTNLNVFHDANENIRIVCKSCGWHTIFRWDARYDAWEPTTKGGIQQFCARHAVCR